MLTQECYRSYLAQRTETFWKIIWKWKTCNDFLTASEFYFEDIMSSSFCKLLDLRDVLLRPAASISNHLA